MLAKTLSYTIMWIAIFILLAVVIYLADETGEYVRSLFQQIADAFPRN